MSPLTISKGFFLGGGLVGGLECDGLLVESRLYNNRCPAGELGSRAVDLGADPILPISAPSLTVEGWPQQTLPFYHIVGPLQAP